MKSIFFKIVVLLVMLVVTQTASAIPTFTTKGDFSVLNAQATTNQYTSSRWHTIFRSIRDFRERNTVANANIDVSLTSDLLRLDTTTMTTANNHDDFFAIEDFSYEKDRDRDRVGVPEPSLVALIALGLVGFGLYSRKKNH